MNRPSDPFVEEAWTPTIEEAFSRIRRISPKHYARTRNHLDGSVTRLSPYLTHGFIDLVDVVGVTGSRRRLAPDDKLLFELAWREYFHHLWSHLGDGIFESRIPRDPSIVYADRIPEDLRTASTGIPAIDAAVRTLYTSAYLHNHARMWLASYAVHLRKVDWRTGAEWIYGHLLDGDLASNCLSWQWVAGTLTGRPYLFNAANVQRYAPHWASPGTAIDTGYPELQTIADSPGVITPELRRPGPTVEPALLDRVPIESSIDVGRIDGMSVAVMHPWCLGPLPVADRCIGYLCPEFHARHPWSEKRWEFVLTRMRKACAGIVVGDGATLRRILARARSRVSVETYQSGYREALVQAAVPVEPFRRLFPNPDSPCRSFSEFWTIVKNADVPLHRGERSDPALGDTDANPAAAVPSTGLGSTRER